MTMGTKTEATTARAPRQRQAAMRRLASARAKAPRRPAGGGAAADLAAAERILRNARLGRTA